MRIEAISFKNSSGDSQLKAFCDVKIGDLCIFGCSIYKSDRGMQVYMPTRLANNGKRYPVVRIESRELYQQVTETVVHAYYDWFARTYIPGF